MGDLGFVRLSRDAVKRLRRFLDGFYKEKTLNLCNHPHVITESRGTGLSKETQLYNELLLWLRYYEALVAKRPTQMDVLSKIRKDYDILFTFVKAQNNLISFFGLTDVDVFGGAVYQEDYIPRMDVFLQGLHDLSRSLAVKQGDKRNTHMGFINMRIEEINRLMRNVKEASENLISHTLIDVRDVLNGDPLILAHNRLVYMCRVMYAMSKSWKILREMCIDRINLLRRRLMLALHERPAFSRIYARNALESSVDHVNAYTLLRRLEEDKALFRNALRWGDPDWGAESDAGTDSGDGTDDEDAVSAIDPSDRKKGDDIAGSDEFEDASDGDPSDGGSEKRNDFEVGGEDWTAKYKLTDGSLDDGRGKYSDKKQKKSVDKKDDDAKVKEVKSKRSGDDDEINDRLSNLTLTNDEPSRIENMRRMVEDGLRKTGDKKVFKAILKSQSPYKDLSSESLTAPPYYGGAHASPVPHGMWLTHNTGSGKYAIDDNRMFVTKEGHVFLPPGPNSGGSTVPFTDSSYGEHYTAGGIRHGLPETLYVDSSYPRPRVSFDDSAIQTKTRNHSGKAKRSEKLKASYKTRPLKAEDDYYWDLDIEDGKPLSGSVYESFDNLSDLHAGLEELKPESHEDDGQDNMQINPPPPRQFAASPFVLMDETQPSDSSGITVLTQDSENKSLEQE
uniref:Tegument protein pp150 n=1 Tax=Mastomys natalensis cytomegalovirus 2 TaxID=2973540 RepID=A0A9Y1IMI0_9BETA|nr:tegument protein pp150 [Mastomys natalensis cytomegalovirus 2]WEG69173.1 tegument protein pp150 [Mastomys natalensis cytomegalovirus 2]WEG69312.1 tegument protein pp150 [Mastomys natalensis cytomegalovirus 2]WEG69450.1 tegument protein pp150 [Mastomys natalensis cytomegalovirus 2]WEG69588.1 tegument protein pp150 [Mastomys natalensis cytomegalovirus 2]